ncbi:hypothetical protein EKN56_02315 [Limnobaculum zhutongyuii]|uniref:Uncharacterized protein n=1 Tax=Limnobaculum zhutongyuii TaxID=2498113 RepID=A0A411WH87_9GAMM|nr:hypothetical protein [Limnobaculum zhutongyuii]QBH95337.1 hypothetical protein EKN56_02315 [Limnobaculum zhutongyuii]TQS89045.1 hypothetical protein ELQ32_07585 [Limnobaculum zhutongyuii]
MNLSCFRANMLGLADFSLPRLTTLTDIRSNSVSPNETDEHRQKTRSRFTFKTDSRSKTSSGNR